MTNLLDPISIQVPIVDPKTGRPTAMFQRFLQKLSLSGDFTLSNGVLALSNPPTLTVVFVMLSGAIGTNAGPELIAPRIGSLSKCKVVTKASDGAIDFTFKINRNGANIFSANPTVSHGTAAGTVSTFTTLSPSPLAVAIDDVFTIDMTSGSANWQATVVLE